jgi:hypothetical protein
MTPELWQQMGEYSAGRGTFPGYYDIMAGQVPPSEPSDVQQIQDILKALLEEANRRRKGRGPLYREPSMEGKGGTLSGGGVTVKGI